MSESTTIRGGTFRIRMNTRSKRPTLTPENNAVIQRLTGTKYRKIKNRMILPRTMISSSISIGVYCLVDGFYNDLIRLEVNYLHLRPNVDIVTKRFYFELTVLKLRLAHRLQRRHGRAFITQRKSRRDPFIH